MLDAGIGTLHILSLLAAGLAANAALWSITYQTFEVHFSVVVSFTYAINTA